MDQVSLLGFPTLYLYTSTAENLYLGIGWEVIDHDRYEGDDVTIMSFNLG